MNVKEFVQSIITECKETRYLGFNYDIYPMDLDSILSSENQHICVVPTQYHKSIILHEHQIDSNIKIMNPYNAFLLIIANGLENFSSICFTFCHILTKEYHLLLRLCSYRMKNKQLLFFSSCIDKDYINNLFPAITWYGKEEEFINSNIINVGSIDITISTEFHIYECKEFIHNFCISHLNTDICKTIVIFIPSKKYYDKIMESFPNNNINIYYIHRKSSLQIIHDVIQAIKRRNGNMICFLSPFFEGFPLFNEIDIIIDTGIYFHYQQDSTFETTYSNKYNIIQKLNIARKDERRLYFLLLPESTYYKISEKKYIDYPDYIYMYLQCIYNQIPLHKMFSNQEIIKCHDKFHELRIKPDTLYSVDTYHLLNNTDYIPFYILSIIRFLHRNSHLYYDYCFLLFVCVMTLYIFHKNDGPPIDISQHSYLLYQSLIREEFPYELEEMFLWVTIFLNYFIYKDKKEYSDAFYLDNIKMNQFQIRVFSYFKHWIYPITCAPMNFLIQSSSLNEKSKIRYVISPYYKEKVRSFFYRLPQFEVIPLYNMAINNCFYYINYKNITNPRLGIHKENIPRSIINLVYKKEKFITRDYDKCVISLFVFTPSFQLKLFRQLKTHIQIFLERMKYIKKQRKQFNQLVIKYIQNVVSKAPGMVNNKLFLQDR